MLLFFTTVNSLEFLINETSSHFENTSLKNINVIYNTKFKIYFPSAKLHDNRDCVHRHCLLLEEISK